MFFAANAQSFASDYQYKVLDPKYNPQAEELLKGTLSGISEIELQEPKKFDFGNFFAIFALVVFPIIIVTLAVRTFKEITEEVPGREKQNTANITIEPSAESGNSADVKKQKSRYTGKNIQTKQITTNNKTIMQTGNGLKNIHVSQKAAIKQARIRPALPQRPLTQKEKLPQTANISISKYFSSPEIKAKNPMLLNTSLLSKNKGLCLVEYNKKYSLIGYINNEIFMLNQFDSVQTNEIRSRLSESVDSKDRYIVRLGDYKALVEVTDTKMKLLLEL